MTPYEMEQRQVRDEEKVTLTSDNLTDLVKGLGEATLLFPVLEKDKRHG